MTPIKHDGGKTSSRIVNAKESNTWYPWMAFISQYTPNFDVLPNGKPDKNNKEYIISKGYCTGSIISSR